MTTVASRINPSGNLYINGEFDEISLTTHRTKESNLFAAEFDEVTYSLTNPVIKNKLQYTEEFTTGWSQSNVSVSVNATQSPNGALTAAKVIENTASSHYLLLDSSLISGVQYVQSVFAKSAERAFCHLTPSTGFTTSDCWANFDLSAGTYSIQGANTLGMTAGITNAGDGWWRCWISMAATSTTNGRIAFGPASSLTDGRLGAYTGTTNWGVYMWGAQLELGTTPSIYQGIAAANTIVTPTFAKREASDGRLYVSGEFDEYEFTKNVTFTTPGSSSWTVPSGVTSVTVSLWGGGGGSGGGGYIESGGSGGGGAYASKILSVTPGQSISFTVGAGGGAGGYNGFGQTVGTTGVASTCSSVTAGGGLGGGDGTAGAGGTATGGDINTNGEAGNHVFGNAAASYGGASPNGGERQYTNGANGNAPGGGQKGYGIDFTGKGGDGQVKFEW